MEEYRKWQEDYIIKKAIYEYKTKLEKDIDKLTIQIDSVRGLNDMDKIDIYSLLKSLEDLLIKTNHEIKICSRVLKN